MQHIPLPGSTGFWLRLQLYGDIRLYGYRALRVQGLRICTLSLSLWRPLPLSLFLTGIFGSRFGFSACCACVCVCVRAGWFRTLCDDRDGTIACERERERSCSPEELQVRERRAFSGPEREGASERQGCKPITVRLILGLVYN